MKNNNKILIPLGIGAAVGLIALAVTSKKSASLPILVNDTPSGADQTTPPAPVINVNKVLAKGSTGIEVKELQKLLGFKGVDIDGIFGNQTEGQLLKLKGVKSTSLSKFKSLPNLNQNIYPIGTKLMANVSFVSPTNLYDAIKKADGTYESNYEVGTTVNYGEEIGVIKAVNGTGSWYLIYRDSFWNGGYYFVKASEVKKI